MALATSTTSSGPPLSARKQLPPMHAPLTPSLKRHAQDDIASAKSKSKINPSITFKQPAIPARALTPSTSTVAFSSSPRLAPSSPIKLHEDTPDIVLEAGQAVIFGRHRHGHSTATSSTLLRSAVPSHLSHLSHDLDQPARIYHLPRSAKHASRVHAVVEYVEDEDAMRLLVIGQNGLKLVGKRLLPGQRVDVPRRQDLVLDFYGASVTIAFPQEERERLFTPSSEVELLHTPESSMPPSSPPREARRSSTPLSDAEQDQQNQTPSGSLVEKDDSKEVKQELLESAKPRASTSPRIPQQADEDKPIPEGIDLAALLAMTVVFSGSSKLSLPDLVKHMLESQASLREYGGEPQWEHWCHGILDSNPMFGKVQRHGKDASGRPLQPHYFYNPDLDTDTSRAKELGGLVRPLRTVQRAGGKAIDWRPVGGGRRR